MSAPKQQGELSIIYHGATVTDLAQMFDLDNKTVQKRLQGRVQPMKSVDKYTRYRIKDAAPWLCDAKIDYEELIKTLTPSKMPPMLQDGFWKGQLSRQKYMAQRGELWSTQRVFEVFSEMCKVIRMALLMVPDTVEQRSALTDEQRAIVQEVVDSTLNSLNTAVAEHFAFYEPKPDENGPPVTADVVPVPHVDFEAEEEEDPFA